MTRFIEHIKDTEIVWSDGKPEAEPTQIIVFNQGEQGFASFVAGMGLIGDEKPIAKIFSKLFSVPAFNEFPDPLFPEWRLYQRRSEEGERVFILRMIHFAPTMINDADPNSNNYVWLYSYPILRDIILSLNDCGVNQSTFFTSDTMSIFTPSPSHDLSRLCVFDYMNTEEEPLSLAGIPVHGDILCTPPAWMWSCVFKNFCINDDWGVWIVLLQCPEEFLDRDGMDALLDYAEVVLGLPYSESDFFNAVDSLATMEGMAEDLSLDRFMASGFGDESGEGGMFG